MTGGEIHVSPDPPHQGGTVTITVTGVTFPIELDVSWTPPQASDPARYKITGADGITLVVPGDGTSLLIHAPNNDDVEDWGGMIYP